MTLVVHRLTRTGNRNIELRGVNAVNRGAISKSLAIVQKPMETWVVDAGNLIKKP